MTRYPLMEDAELQLRAFSGRPLSEITPEAAANGDLSAADLRIHEETLRLQAEIARQAGYEQLAANLLRAAELTVVPNDEVLQIYDLLRPSRASWDQLMRLVERLEKVHHAPENARLVREAAEVYKACGLLRRPPADGH
jgi:propanediol dehydratase small subunit